jgi:hypothetical protein
MNKLDPRRRNLAALAATAIIMVLLAALALWHQAAQMAPRSAPETFFPNLASQVREIARIHIETKKSSFDIAFKPAKGWVLPQQNDYPADFDTVRETVVGLAALQTLAPKTARPDWLHYIGLDAPPKGNGVLISLLDEKGHALAALIVGKGEDIGDASGAMGLYVRRPNETQSWLVRSVFQPKADSADWMDKNVLDIDRARIREADVDPVDGPSYNVSRERVSDPDFKLTPLPKGRELAQETVPDGIAAAVVGFTFDDVRSARDFDFANAARVVTRTFDGLIVTVQVIQQGAEYWATVNAEAAPGQADAAKEAREIDAHTSGWAYKLPAYKGQQFMTSLESLLKPKAAKGAK